MLMKRLILLLGALAALAISIPALASAAPALTSPAGTLVPKGTKLTLTSFNVKTVTIYGQFLCKTVEVPVVVNENTGTSVSLAATGLPPSPECIFGNPGEWPEVVITNLTMPSFVFKAAGTGTSAVTFEADFVPIHTTCHYESATVPITYLSGATSFKVNGNLKGKTHEPDCTAGATFSGDFSIKTTGGSSVIID